MNLLICSGGANPVPNYVVCRYLLDKFREDVEKMPIPDLILFLQTEKTQDYYKNLKKILIEEDREKKNLGVTCEDFKYCNISSERDFSEIRKNLNEKLNEIQDSLKKDKKTLTHIHFNITGGTKPMVVCGYQEISSFCKLSKNQPPIKFAYSDLNPKNHTINYICEDDSANLFYPEEDNLLDKVKIKMGDLFKLHNLHYEDCGSKNENLYDINFKRVFENKVNSKNNSFRYLGLAQYGMDIKEIDKLREISKDNRIKHKNHRNKKLFVRLKNTNLLEEVYEKEGEESLGIFRENLEQLLSLFKKIASDFTFDFENVKVKEFVDLMKFLDGDWLEQFLWKILLEFKDEINIDDVKWSVEPDIEETLENNRKYCELDLIVLRGYQITTFSCTTDYNKHILKNKGFEVFFRSRQLGGHAAKSVLVITSNDQNLKTELLEDLKSFEGTEYFTVIHYEDLCDKAVLKEKLKEILEAPDFKKLDGE